MHAFYSQPLLCWSSLLNIFSHRAHSSLLRIKCHRDPGKLRLVQPRACKSWGIWMPIPTGTAAEQANVAQCESNFQCFKSNGMEASDFPISLKRKKKRNGNFWLSMRRTQMWNYQKFQFLANFNKHSKHELKQFSFRGVVVVRDLLGVRNVPTILCQCKVSIKQQVVQGIQPVYNSHFKLFLLWRQK